MFSAEAPGLAHRNDPIEGEIYVLSLVRRIRGKKADDS
jgi:hypothetical protein